MAQLGDTLRRLRLSRGETLLQVAHATGLSPAMLSRIERGQRFPSPAALACLAEYFGLDVRSTLEHAALERIRERYGTAASFHTSTVLLITREDARLDTVHSGASPYAPDRNPLSATSSTEAEAACRALAATARRAKALLEEIARQHPDDRVRSVARELLEDW